MSSSNSAVVYARWPSIVSRWPEITTAVLLLCAATFSQFISLSHDVLWQAWIARQVIGGATLYQDILEVNPPLWYWLAIPVQWAASLAGIAPTKAITLADVVWAAISIGLVLRLVDDLDTRQRAAIAISGVVALTIMPATSFGQREHLALIGAFAYAVLIARRADGKHIDWPLAVAVGVAAAIGFAMKHYFVVVPVLLELWLLARNHWSWRSRFRPETMVLGCSAIGYVVAMAVVTPDYFTAIVPMLRAGYWGYDVSLPVLLGRVSLLAIPFAVAFHLRKTSSNVATAATIAAVGFTVAYLLQRKGFPYHALPVAGLLCVALSLSALSASNLRARIYLSCAGIMLVTWVVKNATYEYQIRHGREQMVGSLLTGVAAGSTVMAISTTPSGVFNAVEKGGYVWPSRHMTIWMLSAFLKDVRDNGRLSPELEALAEMVRTQTAEDLWCNPPAIILVDERTKSLGLDSIEFFNRNASFKQLFANYEKAETSGYFTSYVRTKAVSPRDESGCRTIY